MRRFIPRSIKQGIKLHLKKISDFIWFKSVEGAIKEQGLKDLFIRLEQIVSDIKNQYSSFKVNTAFLKTKVRGMHAFQISLVCDALKDVEDPVIVDIGDSAGTHLQYLLGLYSDKNIRCLSVNLDADAVERIREKGLEAVCARAEDLKGYDINADVFICFEVLEHLMNPCFFLHELSAKTNARCLIISAPYLRKSRVGLHHIRNNRRDNANAENTHIFELSPEDWKLIVRHSGWNVVSERIYLQYPKLGFYRVTRHLWKKLDFEGFYGLILKRDDTWSSKYLDW